MTPSLALLAFLTWIAPSLAQTPPPAAAITGRPMEYKDGEQILEGYVAVPKPTKAAKSGGKHPVVVIFHEWMGPTAYERGRADQLAGLGYTAFVADMYGKGIRPQNADEAATMSNRFKADRQSLRRRAQVAVAAAQSLPEAAPGQVAAIGYCFGGTVALEVARSGAAIQGAVSFHGNLDTPTPQDARQIRGSVLALTGAADPFVPRAQVQGFEDEMQKARVDWALVTFGGAVHGFTNPAQGNDPSKGAAYDVVADRRSWAIFKGFLAEIFQKKS